MDTANIEWTKRDPNIELPEHEIGDSVFLEGKDVWHLRFRSQVDYLQE